MELVCVPGQRCPQTQLQGDSDCPFAPSTLQISGYHLRILAATAADSGEYVCRLSDASSGAVQEASIVVTIYGTSQSESNNALAMRRLASQRQ